MSVFFSELIGTFLLILLGNGVVANVVLKKTLGHQAGWLAITCGWMVAVFVGVFVAAKSGGHLNPAVTIAMAYLGKISAATAVQYIIAQLLGAMIGTSFVVLSYKDHYAVTEDTGAILGSFCTGPVFSNPISNIISEALGAFVLVYAALHLAAPGYTLGALDALPIALVVLGIGLSLGGPTGYAINPARDLGPRIVHTLLPLKHKGSSNWSYSWIPVVGPILGGLVAAIVFQLVG